MARPQHGASGPSPKGKARRASRKVADAASELGGQAADAVERAAEHPWFERAARTGYAANGVLHGVLGILAFRVALGARASADQAGALEAISRQPFGAVLLWAGCAGCLMLGLWHAASAFLDVRFMAGRQTSPGSKAGRRRWFRVVKDVSTGVVFLAVGGFFAVYALGGRADSSTSTRRLSADLMSTPGGSVLLLLLGATLLVVGGYFVFKGFSRKFEEDLSLPSGRGARRAVRVLGTAGYAAKGLALGLLGLLFIVATIQRDPQESTGLDGALKSLRDQPFGPPVLAAIGVGLLCYGAYLALRARYARMD